MKKIIYTLAVASVLTNCGSKKEEKKDVGNDSTVTTQNKEPEITEDASILDPMKDDLSKTITTTQLTKSMRACINKEIQIVVYPTVYVDKDKCTQDMSASARADKDEKNVTINFNAVPDLAINKGKPYLLKGKLTGIGYWKELQISEASLEEIKGEAKTAPYNPKAISGKIIYDPLDIINSLMAWDKKVITVTGDYWGTSTSKSSDGKKLLEERVDLQLPGDEYKVGCGFEKEGAAKELQAGQKNVTIKGELEYMLRMGETPSLLKCELVK